jgi:hypothetical protein
MTGALSRDAGLVLTEARTGPSLRQLGPGVAGHPETLAAAQALVQEEESRRPTGADAGLPHNTLQRDIQVSTEPLTPLLLAEDSRGLLHALQDRS